MAFYTSLIRNPLFNIYLASDSGEQKLRVSFLLSLKPDV
jgi:hypothetical protein